MTFFLTLLMKNTKELPYKFVSIVLLLSLCSEMKIFVGAVQQEINHTYLFECKIRNYTLITINLKIG